MLTPAQLQLSQVNIQTVMGPHGRKPEFPARLDELTQQVWQNYLYQRVIDDLSDEDQATFVQMTQDDAVNQEQVAIFLREKMPDLDERFLEFALENKVETIKGRVEEIAMVTEGEAGAQAKVEELKRLIDLEEWLQVEAMLKAEFADIGYSEEQAMGSFDG